MSAEMYFTGPNSLFEPVSFIKMYSDSTPMVKMPGWSRVVERADTLTIRGGGMANFVTGMMLVDAVNFSNDFESGIDKLVLPYLPGARQDRVNPTGDVLFTVGSVAVAIAARSFDKVIVLDPHSPVAVEYIPNMVEYPLDRVAKMLPEGKYDGVIAADKGGKARAEKFAEALGLPVFYGGKTRDVSTGRLTGFTLESLYAHKEPNGHFLVVDDICDGGGTFIGLAEKIYEQGATADLYVSHGLFSKGTTDLNANFFDIYTTDSLPQDDTNGVTVLPVVKDMETYVA